MWSTYIAITQGAYLTTFPSTAAFIVTTAGMSVTPAALGTSSQTLAMWQLVFAESDD